MHRFRSAGLSPLLVIAGVLVVGSAQADVTFERKVTVRAAGPMAGYSSATIVKTEISGQKGRTELSPASEMSADLSVADVRVARLDMDTMYELNPDLKTYREIDLDQLADEISGLRQELEDAVGGQALPIATDTCEWSEAKFRSKKTKEKERIAGKRATRHILSMEQSCTDDSTGQSCDLEWIMEPWMASRLDNYDEVVAFYGAYAERLEMDSLIPQMPGGSQVLLAMFPNRWESLLDEMAEFEGYPMRTVMTLKIGGRACMAAPGEEADGLWSKAAEAGYEDAVDRSGKEAGRAIGDKAGEAMGDGASGAIGASAVGGATKEVISGITGMFKGSSKSSSKRRAAPSDTLTVFRISTELTSWKAKQIDEGQWEIPLDWERQP